MCYLYHNLLPLEKSSYALKRNIQLLLDKLTLDGASSDMI